MPPFRKAATKLVTTDTSLSSVVVGGATPIASTGTGGIVAGALILPSNVPSPTTNALYNDSGTLKFNGSAIASSPAGTTGDIQFNSAGAFAADTGVFTYTAASDLLGVNNIISQIGTSLTVKGSTRVTAGTSGDVTIQSGGSGGTGITAGSVTIKTGDVASLGGPGSVTITTGTYPDAMVHPGTAITIKPATPTISDGVSATTGGAVLIEGGPGQSHLNSPGNGTGAIGGALTLRSGVGGDATANGNTRTGGAGAVVSLLGGAGGSATGSSGTRNGGNGGDVVIGSGAPGTGASSNGSAGTITFNIGATTAASVTAAAVFGFATGMALTGAITPTQLVANTDNWNPTGLSTANVIRVDSSGAIDLSGIVAQETGRMLILYNAGGFDITLLHNSTSTAANRFFCPNAISFTLSQKESTWLRYDGTDTRWTVMGTA